MRDDGCGFNGAGHVGVNQAHEAHGTAAVMVIDGGVVGSERGDALRRDRRLLPPELGESMRRAVEVVLPVPCAGLQ